MTFCYDVNFHSIIFPNCLVIFLMLAVDNTVINVWEANERKCIKSQQNATCNPPKYVQLQINTHTLSQQRQVKSKKSKISIQIVTAGRTDILTKNEEREESRTCKRINQFVWKQKKNTILSLVDINIYQWAAAAAAKEKTKRYARAFFRLFNKSKRCAQKVRCVRDVRGLGGIVTHQQSNIVV